MGAESFYSSKEPVSFTPIYNYVSQQAILFHRKRIFVEELFGFYPSRVELNKNIDALVGMGFLEKIDEDHFWITDNLRKIAEQTDPDVLRTGIMGGGTLEIDPKNVGFSVCVEFDTPLGFLENKSVTYYGHSLNFVVRPGRLYSVIGRVGREEDLINAEEAIYRMLSHLSYLLNAPFFIRNRLHGSSLVVGSTPSPERRTGILVPLPSLTNLSAEQHKALAFYRQYKNYSFDDSPEGFYYQLISLIKILEGVSPTRQDQKDVVVNLLASYKQKLSPDERTKLSEIEELIKSNTKYADFQSITWEYYRHGVSHWREKPELFLDPDKPDQILARLVRILAKIVEMILDDKFKIGR